MSGLAVRGQGIMLDLESRDTFAMGAVRQICLLSFANSAVRHCDERDEETDSVGVFALISSAIAWGDRLA